SFAAGPSLDLSYYRSVAVDLSLIPRGSLVYVPDYKSKNKDGWFRADDTGGAINGRHIDVYRPPPSRSSDSGNYLTGRRIFVVPKDRIAAYLKSHGAAASSAQR
ncbi:MAG: 3D domain-containing protein, partial [Actinomycetes bacterium]